MRILRRHPPRDDIEKRQAEIKRDLAEPARDREQHRRQRRIDEVEVSGGIVGVEVPAMQHLLPRPEPQRIVLGLAAAPDFRDQDIGSQGDTADQKQEIERPS